MIKQCLSSWAFWWVHTSISIFIKRRAWWYVWTETLSTPGLSSRLENDRLWVVWLHLDLQRVKRNSLLSVQFRLQRRYRRLSLFPPPLFSSPASLSFCCDSIPCSKIVIAASGLCVVKEISEANRLSQKRWVLIFKSCVSFIVFFFAKPASTVVQVFLKSRFLRSLNSC